MRLIRAYAAAELLALARQPGYWVPTILFPAMLFLFFGNSFRPGGTAGANFILASWAVYAVLGVAFYQFGVGIAQDRETPWDRYLRTLPASLAPRLAARVATALLFAVAAALLVGLVAMAFFPVRLGPGRLASLLLVLLFGGTVFAIFGIALGYLLSARASVPVANLVYLPLAFVGGLWVPPHALPGAVETLSRLTPTRHFAELAWSASGSGGPFPVPSLAVLAGYGAVFAGVALWGYRRDWSARYR